jgi:hypothetical protein
MEFKDVVLPAELGSKTVPGIGNRAHMEFYRHVAEYAANQTWAEFGVHCGGSTKKLLKLLGTGGELNLFDSLKGLPEDWWLNGKDNSPERKGSYNSRGVKHVEEDRVRWHVGWFKDVLPVPFREQLGLVHLDADLYSSTRDALTGIRDYIGPGTVLIFDELIEWKYWSGKRGTNTNWREGEYKALAETGLDVDWLATDGACAVGGVIK